MAAIVRRFRAWWSETYPWCECYPEGWKSRTGVGMPCKDCDRLHEYERLARERQRQEAERLATRPEAV